MTRGVEVRSNPPFHIPRTPGGRCVVARREVLVAYNAQVRQLPGDLQHRECGLIQIGRQHARNFDAGHHPSGNSAARVLTELRKLAAKRASTRDSQTATPVKSELDRLRERHASRLADAQD
jgi:hypothetical protein